MGFLKKDKAPKAPKPVVPKRAVVSHEDKTVLLEQTARYRMAFIEESYDFGAECEYVPRTLMTPRFTDFDHRGVHPLNTPPTARCVNIAVGETDGRIYATWTFLAPLTVGSLITDRMVQVSGIYVGADVPDCYLTPDSPFAEENTSVFSQASMDVFNSISLSGGVWIEHGWILTDFPTVQPDINISVASWGHLSKMIDILEPSLRQLGCDFGAKRDSVDALTEIFPSFRSAMMR